ncbi:hypothetical protein [Actinoplanes sp. NPDC051851]|uniref:hypothetical protein n=1 Tax=Actinoplanes sp. NPDC051851 TaxID=3154753 RepID=UPI00341D41B6
MENRGHHAAVVTFAQWEPLARRALADRGISRREANTLIRGAHAWFEASAESPCQALGTPDEFADDIVTDRPRRRSSPLARWGLTIAASLISTGITLADLPARRVDDTSALGVFLASLALCCLLAYPRKPRTSASDPWFDRPENRLSPPRVDWSAVLATQSRLLRAGNPATCTPAIPAARARTRRATGPERPRTPRTPYRPR